MKHEGLYNDARDEALAAISKEEAAFLQKEWVPNRIGNASLRFKGFDFFLYPWSGGIVWAGQVSRKGWGETEKLKPNEGRSSAVDAKLALYKKMKNIQGRRKIRLTAERRERKVMLAAKKQA